MMLVSRTGRLFASWLAALLLIGSCLLPGALRAQSAPDPRLAALETQLTAMEQAFLKEDFEAYADFIHPDVLRLAGGADALASQLRRGAAALEAKGAKVLGLKHAAPSRLVKVDRELQCTVPQTTDYQVGTATKTIGTTLVAVSTDGGQHWAFVDTNGKDWEATRRLLPSLSRELVLPSKLQP